MLQVAPKMTYQTPPNNVPKRVLAVLATALAVVGFVAMMSQQTQVQTAGVASTALSGTDCGGETCYTVPNNLWPLPPSHCQEIDNPGGSSSAFWAKHGGEFTKYWRSGKCPGVFNSVTKEEKNYDNYDGVTMTYFVSKH